MQSNKMPTTSHTYESIKATFEKAGQDHVLHYFDSLNAEEQKSLLAQLSDIDPSRVLSTHPSISAVKRLNITIIGTWHFQDRHGCRRCAY